VTLETRLSAFATRVGAEIKKLRGEVETIELTPGPAGADGMTVQQDPNDPNALIVYEGGPGPNNAAVASIVAADGPTRTALRTEFLRAGGWSDVVLDSLGHLADPVFTPTITYAPEYTASGIASFVQYRPVICNTGSAVNDWDGQNDPNFRLHPGRFRTAHGGSNDMALAGMVKPGGASQAAYWPIIVEFDTTAPQVEIASYGGGTRLEMRIEVNGQPVIGDYTLTSPTLAAGRRALLTFPDARAKRMVIYLTGDTGLYALRVPTGYTITKPTTTRRTGVVVGDSYPGGSGSPTLYPAGTGIFDTWALRVLSALACSDKVLAAIGGTCFTKDAAAGSRYIDRVPIILSMNPQLLVVSGSINDPADGAGVQAGLEAFLDATASIPERYVVGVTKAGFEAQHDALRVGAANKGVPFIDMKSFIYGAGNAANPANSAGNAGIFLLGDGSHPTLMGHRAIAAAIFRQIAALKDLAR
jgi:hypothetical protein